MTAFPRRVHFLSYGLHPPWSEGTRVVTRDLMRALQAEGVPVDGVSTCPPGATPATDLDIAYVRESVVGDLVERAGGYRYNRDLPMHARLAWRLGRTVARRTDDVVHAGFASHTVYSLVTEAVGGGPFVAQTFGGVENAGALALAGTTSRVDAYVSSSRSDLAVLRDLGVPDAKLHHLPPPVFTDQFGPGDREAGRELLGVDADFVVGYFGNVNEDRFPFEVARRLDRYADDAGVEVVVVTKQVEGPDIGTLDNLRVVDRTLSTREKRAAYLAADVWAFPYQFEDGTDAPVIDPPLTVLEAMASGRPVVVPAVLSLPKVVSDDAGVVLGAATPDAVVAAVEELRSDRDRLASMGDAARRTVARQFGPESVATRLLEIYRSARTHA